MRQKTFKKNYFTIHGLYRNCGWKLKTKILLVFLVLTLNQSMAEFSLKKHSINSGGNTSSGGQYMISGSIGQVDANSGFSSANYQLTGGFWQPINDEIFKNGFE